MIRKSKREAQAVALTRTANASVKEEVLGKNDSKTFPTSFRLKADTIAALKEFAGTHNPDGLSRTQIVEAALLEYIKNHS